MARTLILCALSFVVAVGCLSATPTPDPYNPVIKLQVSPMAAPRPALRYQLLPDLREMQSGQVIHNFLKCFMEQNNFFFNKEVVDKREKHATMPLDELPLKELQNYGGHALKQADYAARLDTVDWQMLPVIRRDGMLTLLSEVQQMRMLAQALKVRFRVEVAEKRFDDALRTAKTTFALGRTFGKHPTLIGNLVGVAVCQIGIGPLEEMIGQPGCPNLYWALSNLPSQIVDLRMGVQGEKFVLGVEMDDLDNPEPMSEPEVKKLLAKVIEVMKYLDGPKVDAKEYVAEKIADKAHVQAARKRLIEAGFDAKKINACLPTQIVLMDEKLNFLVEHDEISKAMLLPYYEMERVLSGVKQKRGDEGLFLSLVAAMPKVKAANTRLEQRFALLRVVEALRMHAAEKGSFPAKLSEINVPLPMDPVTGKAFEYKLENGKASLRGAPTPTGKKSFQVRYELTLRK